MLWLPGGVVYTQYSPSYGLEKLGLARQGEDFFGDVVRDAPKVIAPEDMERHLRNLTKENMLRGIEKNGLFTHNYRMVINGKTIPASLKATMVEENDGKKIIIGVTNDETAELRHKLEETQKIRDLNQTITSLLDNMPGMTFTKDAETGVYLTCNRSFAEYAHKASPDEVAGLTDAEIFDAETARHFVEDDQLALSMDKPYIFFEDVPDAVGDQRQFQTTKFKYVDATGRLCLQGICQDVTDMVRIQRENATTKEAYEKASNTAAIYNHLIMEGKPVHVQMKAAMMEEKDGPRLIVGLNDIDAQVRQEEEFGRRLMEAQMQANIDGLTGVKNKHAYLEIETQMDRQIESRRQTPFAIVLFDVNDLKKVNDTRRASGRGSVSAGRLQGHL